MQLDMARYNQALELARSRHRGGVIARGIRNKKAVRAVQERLSALGYEVSTDGVFGQETEKALKDFQHDHGVRSDGILGRQTLGAILKAKRNDEQETNAADPGIDAITAVVAPGTAQTAKRTKGLGDIKAEQEGGGSSKSTGGDGEAKKGPHGGSLDSAGNEIATSKTGPIGSTEIDKPTKMTWEKDDPKAREAQNNNPQFNELHPRGEAGATNGGQFVAKGDSGQLVTNAQSAINEAYDMPRKDAPGLKVDGEFGPKTEAAVKQFQQENDLKVDGIVGLQTTAALRRALAGKKKPKESS